MKECVVNINHACSMLDQLPYNNLVLDVKILLLLTCIVSSSNNLISIFQEVCGFSYSRSSCLAINWNSSYLPGSKFHIILTYFLPNAIKIWHRFAAAMYMFVQCTKGIYTIYMVCRRDVICLHNGEQACKHQLKWFTWYFDRHATSLCFR